MENSQMKHSFVTPIIVKIAKKLGVEIHVEPKYGYAAQIILPDGHVRYFQNTNFDLNTLGASEIAKDKAYAAYFMKRLGYPVPNGKSFFTVKWAKTINSNNDPNAAYQYARSLGFPVIVKPNSKSQGSGVAKVFNKKEFMQAVNILSWNERVFLVQQVVIGNDYRIVVIDEQVISAYQRLPLSVIGDGHSSVRQLLLKKQADFERIGRDTKIPIDDFRIKLRLKRLKKSEQSVLSKNEHLKLLVNANLSTGGDAVDATQEIHLEWKNLAIRLTKDMNLRYCGVDVIINGTLREPPKKFVVLEVNAAPGLDNYSSVGSKQHHIVENMYEKVLKAMLL